MNVLLLVEGNAETRDSWSGSAKSLVDHLRSAGHTVIVGDVDLYGADRWLAAAATIARPRRRWSARYRLAPAPFRRRTRNAAHLVARHGPAIDLILQIGATFEAPHGVQVPYVVYCDSNIAMAQRGAEYGPTQATWLSGRELADVRQREGAIYQRMDLVFTISHRLRQSFIEDFQLPDAKVVTVHAGPNFDAGRLLDISRTAVRDRPPTVLFVGRQFARKGGDVLISAMELVRGRIPDARLVVIGPPSLGHSHPGVTSLGYLDKDDPVGARRLTEAYAEADVFCLPTRFEPFGIVFLEAMYAGLPCVGPRAWAVPEMIADEDTGYTVSIDDVQGLADRLVRLLTNPDLARAMGARGRERAVRLFTWDAVVARMTDAVRGIAADGHATAHRAP